MTDIEFIDLFFKQLPLILTLSGVSLAYFIYAFNLENYYILKKTRNYKFIYNFLSRKWYFDRLYNEILGQNIISFSYTFSYKDIDRGIIEILGPSSMIYSISNIQQEIKKYQSGNIFHYLFMFALSLLIILFVYLELDKHFIKSCF